MPSRTVVLVLLCLALPGCPDEGPLCAEGLSRCADACVDLSSTAAACGACGVVCSATQQCVEGACACRTGTVRCGGACVVPASDPENCGGCAGEGGGVCGAQQVCERGACGEACALEGSVRCGRSCVDVRADAFHCGGCGQVCADTRSCHDGVCADDVLVACFNTGQVVGFQAGTDVRGPAVAVGTGPVALAALRDVLLVLDVSSRLLQLRLSDYVELPARAVTGQVPNQVLVRASFVYVLNSTSNTLQVLRRDGEALTNVGSVNLGANTNPYAFVLEGPDAYVSLLGNLQGDASAGGRVVRVSLAEPGAPVQVDSFVLPSGEALRPFAGRSTLPAPAGLAVLEGRVYAALGNLDARDYSAGGPGFLARITPGSRAVELLALGEACLNPFWVRAVAGRLLVSCGGAATYDADFNLTAVRGTGLVLLGADGRVLDTLALGCPEATSCVLPSAGRFDVVGSRVYVGDNNAGRLFVLELVGDRLVERRGLGAGAAPALTPCPRASGPSLVSDVLALP